MTGNPSTHEKRGKPCLVHDKYALSIGHAFQWSSRLVPREPSSLTASVSSWQASLPTVALPLRLVEARFGMVLSSF